MDLLNDENFNFQTVGARLPGRVLAPLLNEQTEKIVLAHLSEDKKRSSNLFKISETVNYRERHFSEDLNEIIEVFQQLKRGILEKLPNQKQEKPVFIRLL